MLVVQLIRHKRDGAALADDDIRAFIAGVSDGSIPDYQIAAMLMAMVFRGLDDRELATWSDAMTRSGDVLDLSAIARPKIDKHSTGGVGDKISIPLAPAVAACGVAVPMVSGRGLGHTGGTLDKLESIPGFRVDLPVDRFARQVDELGACLIGQTARIAPADKRLYALRDVTGTVESIPLIASSIMSKKLAEGIDGLVLDCKVGRGAFVKTVERARELCALMRAIAHAAGKRMTCVLTQMDAPIGRAIGNALEIRESIDVLRGGGPADTRELTSVLGAEMLVLGGVAKDTGDGRRRIDAALADGRALDVFRRIVAAQGGDARVCDDPDAVLPRAACRAGRARGRPDRRDRQRGARHRRRVARRRPPHHRRPHQPGRRVRRRGGHQRRDRAGQRDAPPRPADRRPATRRGACDARARVRDRSHRSCATGDQPRHRGDRMTELYDRIQHAARAIRERGARTPTVALVLGSGLGGYADRLADAVAIDYADIPHFPQSRVEGHRGRLVVGSRAGATCVAMQGRVHLYEGHSAADVAFPVRVMIALGAQVVIVTNAAGGLDPSWPPGTLMLIADHVDMLRDHALRGPNDDRLGPRFPDMTHTYDARLRELARRCATQAGITLAEGIYVAMPGPTYETPAEVRMLQLLGAQATGMSTVPEVIAARHMGAHVLGISCITNHAAGITGQPLTHDEVTTTAATARTRFETVLDGVLGAIAKGDA